MNKSRNLKLESEILLSKSLSIGTANNIEIPGKHIQLYAN
jgi:hypothetical protein